MFIETEEHSSGNSGGLASKAIHTPYPFPETDYRFVRQESGINS